MSADDDILGPHEESDDIDFEMELINSADGKIITLVCFCDHELAPDEYAEALKAFADRICTLMDMTEVQTGVMN